jgi:hypothetical protein
MLTTNTSTHHPSWLGYLGCYVLFAVLLVLDLAVLLIWRVTILVLLATFLGPGSANSALYDFSLVVLGIAFFGLIIAAEPYLRNGVKQGRLLYRFARLAVPLGLFGALGLLLGSWL